MAGRRTQTGGALWEMRSEMEMQLLPLQVMRGNAAPGPSFMLPPFHITPNPLGPNLSDSRHININKNTKRKNVK